MGGVQPSTEVFSVDGSTCLGQFVIDLGDFLFQVAATALLGPRLPMRGFALHGFERLPLTEPEQKYRVLSAELRQGGVGRLRIERPAVFIHETVLHQAVVRPPPELHPEAIATASLVADARDQCLWR